MPAWFQEKLKRKYTEEESAIERALRSGFAKIISSNLETTEHLIAFEDGNCLSFYENIVEAPFDRSKCVPPTKEYLEAVQKLREPV